MTYQIKELEPRVEELVHNLSYFPKLVISTFQVICLRVGLPRGKLLSLSEQLAILLG